jgi:predicted GIY-YIG superfamily endonuclease
MRGMTLAISRVVAFWVYVLSRADGSQTVGLTEDLDRQLGNVVLGPGSPYPRAIRPVRLEHVEEVASRAAAQERVQRIRRRINAS